MSVKRFVAADMRRALELVRQEMGPDSIILSSKRVKQGVEILTRCESVEQLPQEQVEHARGLAATEIAMDSDSAWRDQKVVKQALESSGHKVMGTDLDAAAAELTPSRVSADKARPNRGQASGKTPAELTAEMDSARSRMMAAKEAGRFNNTSIATLAERSNHGDESSDYRPMHSARGEHLSDSDDPFSDVYPDELEAPQVQKSDMQMQALQAELADMRLLLEDQLTRMARTPVMSNPVASGLLRRFHHMGFPTSLCEPLVARVREQQSIQKAWVEALALLSRSLPVSKEDLIMQGGVFAFVGSTGVGKTTTIAKLAARYVLANGAENVTLVTTDTYRIAAHDQLRSLGRILNVQVKVVEDNKDLPAVLRGLKHCPLVLIDTAGFRQGDEQLKEQLAVLESIEQVKTLLVLSSNSQTQLMKASVHAHRSRKLLGCVLTKLDDTASMGEALGVVLEYRLPVAYITDGQDIPQDIELARGHKLAAKAAALLKASSGRQQTA